MPSRTQLLEELDQVAERLGHPPTVREMQEHGSYSVSQYKEEFGSWTNALETGGYDLARQGVEQKAEKYLEEIQRLAEELVRRPTQEDLRKNGRFSISPYQNHFGSWSNALERAGFEKPASSKYSEERYLDELRRLAEELGHPPRSTDMREQGKHSPTTYTRRFGSWKNALEAAGLDPDWDQLDDEELLDELNRIAEEHQDPPNVQTVIEEAKYSARTYEDHFGSVKAALEEAGFSTDHIVFSLSDDELIQELQRLAEELGHVPSLQDFRDEGRYSVSTYFSHFGSWQAAVEAAGFEPQSRQEKIPREALIAELKRLADELGKVPYKREMNEQGEYHSDTYARRFGTWTEALEEAGLERN